MTERAGFVRCIHDADTAFVLGVTGGGSQAISQLLSVPGASRSVLEAAVPYSASALQDWLTSLPEQYCSAATARLIAMASFARACDYAVRDEIQRSIVGLGCTASLASDRPKRGPHRVHVAWQSAGATATYSLELEKDVRSRGEEEALAADLILNAIADAARLADGITLPLRDGEHVESRRTTAPAAWRALVMESGPPVAHGAAVVEKPVLFPGAFHPLHAGHRGIAAVATRRLGRQVTFEISVQNVDKPPLDYTEIEDRLAQFGADEGVWLTAAPTFVEKARLFPGATFLVGYDTIVRIGEARYYAGSDSGRDDAIQELSQLGCRFIVFGRRGEEGFRSLKDAALPPELRALCDEVPEQDFRADISSTELRRGT